METVLRDYRIEDIPELLSLIKEAFKEQRGLVDPPSSAESKTVEVIKQELAGSNAIVAELDGKIIGCVFYHPKTDLVYFDRLSVAKEHRNMGLGSRMIDLVEKRARKSGFSGMSLSVRIELKKQQGFYKDRGYRIVAYESHEGFERPTYVVMEKTL